MKDFRRYLEKQMDDKEFRKNGKNPKPNTA